ncbi:unnamed protein product [Effrenium voratum]|uniref:Protein C10 n=1 Tax=Effrenium voratum TaxID=2562239 RepID=A0AA36IIB7_9DINO|nr:unnamed protein product [Effrenium voratum]
MKLQVLLTFGKKSRGHPTRNFWKLFGMTMNMDWKEPMSPQDLDAQRRAREERALVQGSSDFFGLNHYSTDFVSERLSTSDGENYFSDQAGLGDALRALRPGAGLRTDMGWDVVPWGFERLLTWIHQTYAPPGGILVTENGCAIRETCEADALNDTFRVEYLQGYLAQMHKAMANGADVRGYLVWSFMDNFEWAFGFSKRFGIVRVDFGSQERLVKASARLMESLAKENKLKVPSRIHSAAEFTPFNRLEETKPEKKGSRPQLSKEDARRMLREFCEKYQDDTFQGKMVNCYQQFMIHNDELKLLKARRSLCMPIQAEIIPKYGFEPTSRGVSQVQATLTNASMMEESQTSRT